MTAHRAALLAAVVVLVAPAAAQAAAPTVTTGDVADIAPTTATATGSVGPGGPATDVLVDVGTSTAYGTTTTLATHPSGTAAVAVTQALGDLQPATLYHVRLRATNADGSAMGADRTFTTAPAPATTPAPAPAPALPAAATGTPTAVTATAATLRASVTPNGQRTAAVFDYGTSASYGSSSSAVDAGDSASAQAVSSTVSNLRASTTYHYRVRATSAAGTTLGADRTFRTPAAPAAAVAPSLSGTRVASTSTTGAVIATRVSARGRATRVLVEYGPTTSLGAQTATVDAGSSTGTRTVTVAIDGLAPAKAYRARIVAVSDGGTTRSGQVRLTTRTPNAVTATPASLRITYGQATRITGTVSGSGAGGATVALAQAVSPFTAFTALGLTKASSRGTYGFDVRPLVRTRYAVTAAPVGAAPVAVTTKSVLVAPRAGFSATRLRDGRVRLSGRIVPRGNARVSLRRVGTGGKLIVVTGTDARPSQNASTYRLTRRLRAGSYLVRVLPSSGRGLVAATSRTIRLR